MCINYTPQHLEVWPPGQHVITTTEDGRVVVRIASMVRREFLRIMMFDARNLEIPDVLYVKWDDGEAKSYPMGPLRLYPRWLLLLAQVVFIVGIVSIVYGILRALQALVG